MAAMVESNISSYTPWYKSRTNSHPFSVTQKISPSDHKDQPFRSIAIFPWTRESLDILWDGDLSNPDLLSGWNEMILQWSGAYAVGGASKVYVISLRGSIKPLRLTIPDSPGDVQNVAWALSQDAPLEPLVIFSCTSVIYILNVKNRQITSYLRGHGGPITAIAVHPMHPYLFCTTSRDYTTRIYDLTLTPQQTPSNPHWARKNVPSLAGAAHGLHSTEPEGIGYGRCVAVLSGGRSGGHQAAVLGAAFHPALPLIATCGLDRTVKIWRLPSLSEETLTREDKPLFSSSRIHKAGVLSVTWLSQDILLSHSAPALMRRRPNEANSVYYEAGTLVLWRWLGVDRFFPPGKPYQKILRGCASDYQESASFKLVSISSLPMQMRYLHVYRSPSHDPLVLFPSDNTMRALNVTHFVPRKQPAFPINEQGVEELTKRMRLDDGVLPEEDEDHRNLGGSISASPPQVDGWTIEQGPGEAVSEKAKCSDLVACAMGIDGNVIIGVSTTGSILVWAAQERV